MEEANANAHPSRDSILDAIHGLKIHFALQLQKVITSYQALKDTIGVFLERLTSPESRVGKMEDDISTLTSKEPCRCQKVQELTLNVADLENRSWRSNLRLIGLPERAEEEDITAFL
ncbi:hypothetical protein ILYODFUR_031639 [Ilyodon furcidens]|uniref:Uncharacterized protein n=1 Tax=Ilyodon furcidens TaxID=33524 RepID=A0ABV0TZZ3_9TELE